MKKLCFGTILNLIYQAKSQGVTYVLICNKIFEAFGADNELKRDKALPGHLKSGHDNLPTDVIEAAREMPYETAIENVEESVASLIADEQRKNFIRAIKAVLKEDSVDEDTVIGYIDFTKRGIIENNKFVFSPLLASILRYSITEVSNHACEEFLKGFEKDYLSTMDEKISVFIDPLHKAVAENEEEGVLKKTLNDGTFGQVFRKVSSVIVSGMTHPSTADIYCADLRNGKIRFQKVKGYLADNIGTYVFSRSKIDSFSEMHRPAGALGTQALIQFQRAYGNNADAMLGELLLYVFLEQELNAPKIMSKIEFFKQGDGIESKSDGIHLLATTEFGRPFNQIVFGASNIQGDLRNAVDRAFERITAIEDNADLEFSMVEKTSQHFIFDNATNEYIRNLMIPNSRYTSKPDMAFGMFLGYTLTVDPPTADSALYRKEAEEQLKKDMVSVKDYIAQKITQCGLEGYSFYCYVLPFNDAPVEKTSLIEEMLGGAY